MNRLGMLLLKLAWRCFPPGRRRAGVVWLLGEMPSVRQLPPVIYPAPRPFKLCVACFHGKHEYCLNGHEDLPEYCDCVHRR